MKYWLLCPVFVVFSFAAATGQDSSKSNANAMKIAQYWFVMLKTGPNKTADSLTREHLFDGHMANIRRLYADGILKVAGPFGDNSNQWRGLFIVDCPTKEDAEKYVKTDPAVAAGIFIAEITPWYTAAQGSFVPGKPLKTD